MTNTLLPTDAQTCNCDSIMTRFPCSKIPSKRMTLITSTNEGEDVELMRIVKRRVFHIHGAILTGFPVYISYTWKS